MHEPGHHHGRLSRGEAKGKCSGVLTIREDGPSKYSSNRLGHIFVRWTECKLKRLVHVTLYWVYEAINAGTSFVGCLAVASGSSHRRMPSCFQ
ncbi:hypothetical protein KIN20_007160 [Parelaphostrongylus tenuis]|uniref:Uncharacterized protein n=1 Tax=Parelaphostrongylus tenuis TaxID=148309 RepID=A0AAD5QIX8_PARTN|nr:hypothetical protein KIN20_007160 [Parelaphostrongylus tenuis]